ALQVIGDTLFVGTRKGLSLKTGKHFNTFECPTPNQIFPFGNTCYLATQKGVFQCTPTFGLENDIVFSIDGNYLSDPAGGAGVISSEGTMLNTGATAPGVVAAYYNSNRDDALYRRLDFGLIAGVSYFLNSGLYLGVRYQHGLTDITKGENDLRIIDEDLLEGREFNADDEDFTRSIQASVGFRF
ncbi:MAG: hypothetical protein AAGA62_18230, partial [Bacteroidota bacterium]